MRKLNNNITLLSQEDLSKLKGGEASKKVSYRFCTPIYLKKPKNQTISYIDENGKTVTITVNANNTVTVNTANEIIKIAV